MFMTPDFQKDVILSDYTTICLGGKADNFISCATTESVQETVKYSKENNLSLQVISGGSNIIFPDEGYRGIVMKVDIKGISLKHENGKAKLITGAGENWDETVRYTVDNGLAGLECLSGIPGTAGATPVQNVGAYGQEVKDIVKTVKAIDRKTLDEVKFNNEECNFGYRDSRFKSSDKDRYIITEVIFEFDIKKEPEIKYPELKDYIERSSASLVTKSQIEKLNFIRESVLSLRKKKSMLTDPENPDTRSCGSFFTNPVLKEDEFKSFEKTAEDLNLKFPFYRTGSKYKIPAAWLVENSGFRKGYTENGAGISSSHSLALVNRGCSTEALLELSEKIKIRVKEKFGIRLMTEPVIVKNI